MSGDAEDVPYSLPPADSDVWALFEKLMGEEQFQHLVDGDAQIGILFRWFEETKSGRAVLGTCHMPEVQGKLRPLFDWLIRSLLGFPPDFLIVLDGRYWTSVDTIYREILLFHELRHAIHKTDRYGAPRFTREGAPMWGIAPHDVEEFSDVVARYGQYSDELREFVAAAIDGDRRVDTDRG